MTHSSVRLICFASLVALVGCGSNDDDAAAGGSDEPAGSGSTSGKDGWGSPVTSTYPSIPDPSTCMAVPAQDSLWRWGLEGYWTGTWLHTWFEKEVLPPHDQPSFFLLFLPSGDRNWGAGPGPIAPGSFSFGPDSGANALPGTCTVCPLLHANVWGDNPDAVWFPVAGTVEFEQANADTREYVGTMKNLILRRVGIDGMKSYSRWIVPPDPNHPEQPECLFLAQTSFDTRRVDGRPCKLWTDCPNSRYHVCDAEIASCVESQCDMGERWDGATGMFVPTNATCASDRVCELALDTDDWYYGAHIEHALSTGTCVVP